jgi:hypothetical protein
MSDPVAFGSPGVGPLASQMPRAKAVTAVRYVS